jgi:hypothetical protein
MPTDPSTARTVARRYYVAMAACGLARAMNDPEAVKANDRLKKRIEADPAFEDAMKANTTMPADLQLDVGGEE